MRFAAAQVHLAPAGAHQLLVSRLGHQAQRSYSSPTNFFSAPG
jgi:hypothetical protein